MPSVLDLGYGIQGAFLDAKVDALPVLRFSRRLQSETQEELDALSPSAESATIGRGV